MSSVWFKVVQAKEPRTHQFGFLLKVQRMVYTP